MIYHKMKYFAVLISNIIVFASLNAQNFIGHDLLSELRLFEAEQNNNCHFCADNIFSSLFVEKDVDLQSILEEASNDSPAPNPIGSNIETAFFTSDFNQLCGTEGDIQIVIKNIGTDPIYSIVVEYKVNNGSTTGRHGYRFTTPTVTGQVRSVLFSGIQGLNLSSNIVDLQIISINQQPNPNIATVRTTIDQRRRLMSNDDAGIFSIRLDANPEDVNWVLEDGTTGDTVLVGNGQHHPNHALIIQHFTAISGHCYALKVEDVQGNGICCTNGTGFYSLEIGGIEFVNERHFSFKTGLKFSWELALSGLSTESTVNEWTLYPNPASDEVILSLTNEEVGEAFITFYNALGQVVQERKVIELVVGSQIVTLPVRDLTTGVYFLSIEKGTNVESKQIIIAR